MRFVFSVTHLTLQLQLPAALLRGLGLDEDLLEVVDRARATTSPGARRREERRLAGVLRQVDAAGLKARLSNVQESGNPDTRQFQLAETWRTRLIEELLAEDPEDESLEIYLGPGPWPSPQPVFLPELDAERDAHGHDHDHDH